MKRKRVCEIDQRASNDSEESRKREMPSQGNTAIPQNMWLQCLQKAKKVCTASNGIRRVKYQMEDGSEMLEEYNTNTKCLTRRACRSSEAPLSAPPSWNVEIGESPPPMSPDLEGLKESDDQPIITRRNTRNNLEWRIRNLPYSIEVYSVAANSDDKCIIVKTTNKKYYKRLMVPELERIGLTLRQSNIEYSHKFNTLIITYKKPEELTSFEKMWYEELDKIETTDLPIDDCKTS